MIKHTSAWILTIGVVVHCAGALAAEKEQGPLAPGDWLAKDRAIWMDLSGSKPAVVLKDWYLVGGQTNTKRKRPCKMTHHFDGKHQWS